MDRAARLIPALAGLLSTSALGGDLHVAPVRGDGPSDAGRTRPGIVITWTGEPADLAVLDGRGPRTVARGVRGRFVVRGAEADARVRVVRDGAVLAEGGGVALWRPSDVAAWSGPGLRGQEVVALAPARTGLWAGTRDAGAAFWDGVAWRHLDARVGLPDDRVLALALRDATRWIATEGGVTRIDGDGTRRLWTSEVLGGPATDLLVVDDDAWALVAGSVVTLAAPSAQRVLDRTDCVHLLLDAEGRATAACDVHRPLEGDSARLPDTPVASRALRREGGAWLATADGLVDWHDDAVELWWRPPSGGPVADLAQVGGGMLLALGEDGAALVSEDGVRLLTPADGIHGDRASAVAPGPRVDKAWLGTDRGVALVTAAGSATMLPTAPLPAGAAVHDVAVARRGLAVASDVGCAWVGEGRPRGWGDLQAAVGEPCRAVAATDGVWWGASEHTVFQLERGELTRWTPGGRVVDLLPVGEGLVIATDVGVRRWLPGARQLSPAESVPGLRDADVGPDAALWALGDEGVVRWDSRGRSTWTVPGAVDLAAAGNQALVACADGLRVVDPVSERVVQLAAPAPGTPVEAVDVGLGGGWAVVGGVLHTVGREGAAPLRAYGVDEATTALHAVDGGIWWLTERGLFLARPQTSRE